MNTVMASHRPVSSRLHVRPLVASLGLALTIGAADCAVAQPELAAGHNSNRPLSGVSGPLRGAPGEAEHEAAAIHLAGTGAKACSMV